MEERQRPRAGRDEPRSASGDAAQAADVDLTFGQQDVTAVRHEVTDRLRNAGLSGDRLQGFVLAVNEVITNVVLHGGGTGRLVLRAHGDVVQCTVSDAGPGIPDHLSSVPTVPGPLEVGGRGIWLAHQLCDKVTLSSGGAGTTVDLWIMLSAADMPAELLDPAATSG